MAAASCSRNGIAPPLDSTRSASSRTPSTTSPEPRLQSLPVGGFMSRSKGYTPEALMQQMKAEMQEMIAKSKAETPDRSPQRYRPSTEYYEAQCRDPQRWLSAPRAGR